MRSMARRINHYAIMPMLAEFAWQLGQRVGGVLTHKDRLDIAGVSLDVQGGCLLHTLHWLG